MFDQSEEEHRKWQEREREKERINKSNEAYQSQRAKETYRITQRNRQARGRSNNIGCLRMIVIVAVLFFVVRSCM
jgi:hypothetical protein